ncbi:ThiJ/PfpI family protein [Hypoxylon trugodes]|uniref:ThiJ/PfpI family protein n=1 Tax=Hypoxylon trugodes TaxID=326681 RepID=UPI002196FA09|nr:ThiJ/PfpI family protein [Hypoxylon trugodes]KAI1385631.1 ThiJ/PfpI family protein [Hypoxylon trugodes]
MAPKVLVVLTSYSFIESANAPTGWYLPEFAHPYDVLAEKGIEIITASPKGGVAPLDPGSVERFKEDPSSVNFKATKSALWENTAPISSFLGKSSEYAALFYPGGHGPMFDLVSDKDSIALIAEFVSAGKPVAAVCHGPIVFANVKRADGKGLLEGKEATGFTNEEEELAAMTKHMPFLLEDKLREVGAVFRKAEKPYDAFVLVQDGGKLITGQNPASAKGVGEEIVKAIGV